MIIIVRCFNLTTVHVHRVCSLTEHAAPPPPPVQNPETGGSGGSRFSMKLLTTRLRGGDTSYFGRMKTATRELQEAEEGAKNAHNELE